MDPQVFPELPDARRTWMGPPSLASVTLVSRGTNRDLIPDRSADWPNPDADVARCAIRAAPCRASGVAARAECYFT